jgi:hypothetical protein
LKGQGGVCSYGFCMSFQMSCGELFALGDCGSGIVVVVLLHMRAHNVAFPQHALYRCITRCLQINLEPGSLIQNGKGEMSSVVSAAGELSWTMRRRYRCVNDNVCLCLCLCPCLCLCLCVSVYPNLFQGIRLPSSIPHVQAASS